MAERSQWFEEYRSLLLRLEEARRSRNDGEEERILDAMDVAWDGMSEDERAFMAAELEREDEEGSGV